MNVFSITAALIGFVQDEALIELFTSAARSVEKRRLSIPLRRAK
jgi:hypothetical protein